MNTQEYKISPPLRNRLEGLKPGEMVRAIVVTRSPEEGETHERLTAQERKTRIAMRREAHKHVREVIISVLAEHNQGQVLDLDLSALSSIVVRATAKGLKRLANEPVVEVILEDQRLQFPQEPPRGSPLRKETGKGSP